MSDAVITINVSEFVAAFNRAGDAVWDAFRFQGPHPAVIRSIAASGVSTEEGQP